MTSRTWTALCLPFLGTLACTSIPGFPTTGSGSKFNLATVEYVDSREAAIAERVTRQFTDELPSILDEALKDERRRLAALEGALIAQQSQMAALVARIDEENQSFSDLSAEVAARMALLEASNGELRSIAGALSTEMSALPSDTLRELNAALNAHLLAKIPGAATDEATQTGEATPAQQPPDAAANPNSGVAESSAPDVAAGPPGNELSPTTSLGSANEVTPSEFRDQP